MDVEGFLQQKIEEGWDEGSEIDFPFVLPALLEGFEKERKMESFFQEEFLGGNPLVYDHGSPVGWTRSYSGRLTKSSGEWDLHLYDDGLSVSWGPRDDNTIVKFHVQLEPFSCEFRYLDSDYGFVEPPPDPCHSYEVYGADHIDHDISKFVPLTEEIKKELILRDLPYPKLEPWGA